MSRDSDIDEIYDVIDELMKSKQYHIIDFIMRNFDLSLDGRCSIDMALSFLTITLPVKSKLNNRDIMIDHIERYAPYNEIEGLLSGLR